MLSSVVASIFAAPGSPLRTAKMSTANLPIVTLSLRLPSFDVIAIVSSGLSIAVFAGASTKVVARR